MEQEGYQMEHGRKGTVYRFYSEGPKGRIKKIIKFQHTPELGLNAFNLAFGDGGEVEESINDLIVTNNGDQLKVLRMVAAAVIDFVNFRPDAIIQIKGSTPARTRLYQMKISGFWREINREFEIWGEDGDEWIPYRSGLNFKRFLLFRKIR